MAMINTGSKWYADASAGNLPCSFKFICNEIFTPAGIQVSEACREYESDEYGAAQFHLNGQRAVFRQAKRTPKKVGQFVTLWKRETPASEIAPLDASDDIEWVIIASDEGARCGVFLFPKAVLIKKGIFSRQHIGGKRAFRVYGPWTTPTANQAQKTKKWQNDYFYEFVEGKMEETIYQINSRVRDRSGVGVIPK
ncbi:MepB family protein [Bacillus sp. FSL W7-1360]